MDDLGAKPVTIALADSLLCVICESIFSNGDLVQGLCPVCNSPSIINLGKVAHASMEDIGGGWVKKANHIRDQLKGVATRIRELQDNIKELEPDNKTINITCQAAHETIMVAVKKLSREITAVVGRGYK